MSLDIKNLVLGYEDKIIVNNIDISISKGEITILIGANGCGKSTLLSGMSRLLIPKEGNVFLEGKSIHDYKPKELAKKLAILPQGPIAPEGITVKELCYFGRNPYKSLFGGRSKEDEEIVNWAIEVTGLKEFEDRKLDSLSGGQRQRLTIARALYKQADILVLDDCSSALDYATDSALQKQLQELKEMTKIIISQRTASLKRCDRIMVLYHGELVGFDSHEQLLKDCQVYQEIYESQNSKEGETNG